MLSGRLLCHTCSAAQSSCQVLLKNISKKTSKTARLVLHCSLRANVCEMHVQLSWLTVGAKQKSGPLLFMQTVLWNKTIFVTGTCSSGSVGSKNKLYDKNCCAWRFFCSECASHQHQKQTFFLKHKLMNLTCFLLLLYWSVLTHFYLFIFYF